MSKEDLERSIRDIPDFPREGVIFKDITPLLQDGELFREAVDLLAEPYLSAPPDLVAAIDARGFIFGAALAYKLGVGLIPIRKEGKLPYDTLKVSYDLEYGSDTVEIHQDAIREGEKVLLVDDLLATGGTLAASAELIKNHGARLIGIAVLIELDFLHGRDKLPDSPLFSLIHY